MPLLAGEPVEVLEAASSGEGGGLSKADEAPGYVKMEVRMSQPKVLLDVPLDVPPEVPPRVPEEVKKRLKGWFYTFWGCTLCHYLCGIGGVLAAAVAASASDNPAIVKVAGISGAVCVSVLGFVQPERQARKYVTAWRLLDEKVNLYKYAQLPLKELIEGMSAAEQMLDQSERETPPPGPAKLYLPPPQ
jgi:hypothetical protein